jgi:hypothetical protein
VKTSSLLLGFGLMIGCTNTKPPVPPVAPNPNSTSAKPEAPTPARPTSGVAPLIGELAPPTVSAPIQPANFLGVASSPLVLGAGYDDTTKKVGAICVTGTEIYVPQLTGGFTTEWDALPSFQIVDNLRVGNQFDFEEASLYGQTPSIKTWTDAAGDDDWQSMNFLLPIVISDVGGPLFRGDDTMRTAECGKDFINGVVVGARLLAGLKLSFAQRADFDAFRAQYGNVLHKVLERNDRDLGWLSVALDGKATLSLQAIQIGGDPSKLQAIVDQSTCSIGDLPACNQTLQQIAGPYKTTFLTDLGPTPTSNANLGGWVVVSATYKPEVIAPPAQ